MRIERRTEARVLRGRSHSEFVEVGFPNHDSARISQPAHHRSLVGSLVAFEKSRPTRGRQSGRGQVVLDRDRNPGQPPNGAHIEIAWGGERQERIEALWTCLLYTSYAADDLSTV